VGLVVTVALAWVAGSRSAFVALAGYAVWRLFWRVRPALARAALVVGLVAAVAAAAWLGRGALMQAARDDVRLPLWQSTLRLAVGHPLLGIGPGNFRREFVAFRQPAQMAKPTTANVTEHPHNELLNVWATGGVLLALAWAAAAVSLLARPRGGGSVSAAHFTAVILFGQSCFDLTLARSPTDLAALLCLGLAWHPFVDASADEGVPEAWPSRTWIAAALAVGLAAAGVWLGGRAAISSWLLRQGAVAESRDEAAAAYEAHATAAKWSVGDPQPDYFAGIVAPRALRSPQLALRHFEAVRNLEPDFVHLNGEIGLALAQAGGHEPALPFFARDAALFPYDVIAQSRHVQCAFNTGQSEGIEAALAALAKARVAERRRALGAETVSGLVRTIERAWERDDDDAGIAAVNRLLNGIPRLPPEPLSRHLIPPATDPAGEWADELTPDDWGTCRRAYKGVPWGRTDGTPQPVAEACLGHGAEDVEAEEDGRGDSGQRVMECFRESGWDVARVLGGDGRDLGWLALRTGTVVQHMHLVQLGGEHGVLTDVTAERLASDADLRRRLGVNDADELGIEVALAAADFSPRLQYLGDVLRCVAPHLRSRLGESPTLRLWRWQQALDCPAGHASDPFPAAPSDQTPRVRVTARLDPDGPEATPGR